MNVKAVPSSPTMRQRLDNLAICLDKGVDFIIKHNLRRESQVEWLDKARQHSDSSVTPRPGKTVVESYWTTLSSTVADIAPGMKPFKECTKPSVLAKKDGFVKVISLNLHKIFPSKRGN
jgi:hypothetical protein